MTAQIIPFVPREVNFDPAMYNSDPAVVLILPVVRIDGDAASARGRRRPRYKRAADACTGLTPEAIRAAGTLTARPFLKAVLDECRPKIQEAVRAAADDMLRRVMVESEERARLERLGLKQET